MTRVVGRSSSGARLVWAIAAVGIAVIGLLVATYAQETADATPVQVVAALSLATDLGG